MRALSVRPRRPRASTDGRCGSDRLGIATHGWYVFALPITTFGPSIPSITNISLLKKYHTNMLLLPVCRGTSYYFLRRRHPLHPPRLRLHRPLVPLRHRPHLRPRRRIRPRRLVTKTRRNHRHYPPNLRFRPFGQYLPYRIRDRLGPWQSVTGFWDGAGPSWG